MDNYALGDEVMLRSEGLLLAKFKRFPRHLVPRWLGPFKVIKASETPNFTLQLPRTMARIHPVFHGNILKRYKARDVEQFPGMKIQAKIVEMGKETGKELFEIEDIIDKDVTVKRGKSITKYRVRWKGYKAEEDSWLTYYPGDPDWIQNQKLVDNWERTRATDLDTKNVQAKCEGRGTVNVQAKCEGRGTVSGVAVRTNDSLGIVAERGRGTKLVRARAARGAQPGSL
jgi:hypothetical protein